MTIHKDLVDTCTLTSATQGAERERSSSTSSSRCSTSAAGEARSDGSDRTGSDVSEDDEACSSCDMSAETLPIQFDTIRRQKSDGVPAAEEEKMVHAAYDDAAATAAAYESTSAAHGGVHQALMDKVDMELLSPGSRTVHRALVRGVRSDAEISSLAGLNDSVVETVETVDRLQNDLSALNAYEDETRRGVETATATNVRVAAVKKHQNAEFRVVSGNRRKRIERILAKDNGGSDALHVARLQQHVGEMARTTLLDDCSESDERDVALAVSSNTKTSVSGSRQLSPAEPSKLGKIEDQIRLGAESALEQTRPASTPPLHAGIVPPYANDVPKPSPPPEMVDTCTPGLNGVDIDVAQGERGRPQNLAPVTAWPISNRPTISFQECIEDKNWDLVRQLLDAEHGKAARQHFFVDEIKECMDSEDIDMQGFHSNRRIEPPRRKVTALHLVCMHNPPVDIVKSFIIFNPEGVCKLNDLGWETPLHFAIGSGMETEAVLALLEAGPSAVSKISSAAARYGRQMSPLHLAVTSIMDGSGPCLAVVRDMCRYNPIARSLRDGSGRTPLELARTEDKCSEELERILTPPKISNDFVVFRAKATFASILVLSAAILLRKLEKVVDAFFCNAHDTLVYATTIGSNGFAVASVICIVALLIVNTTKIIQQDETMQHGEGDRSDEAVTIAYVSAVGIVVLFASEPVTLLLHTTVVTGCALGYSLLRRAKYRTVEDIDSEFLDCCSSSGDAPYRSLSGSSLREYRNIGEDDVAPLERDGLCIICWERPADHVLVPCGHLCLCADCPVRLGDDLNWQCPVGKCQVSAAMKVFPVGLKDNDCNISISSKPAKKENEEVCVPVGGA